MERGTVTSWKEDKNFGFIKTATSSKEVFFHISDIKRGRRKPSVGEVLQFDIQTGNDGKLRAANVWFCKEMADQKRTFTTLSVLLLIIPFIGSILLLSVYGSYLTLVAYLIAIPLSFYAYKADKAKAQKGEWRTPEATLHLLDLLGGWYGGFYAQRKLHHKNKKASFQIVFWTIVTAHLSVWMYFIVKIYQSNFLL